MDLNQTSENAAQGRNAVLFFIVKKYGLKISIQQHQISIFEVIRGNNRQTIG
jgi:hypothetical protein